MTLVSFRVDSGDPVLEAFTDQTYVWLDELKADFERSTGSPFEGGSGVLFANDVLVALHGHDASWARFDVLELERWIEENEPGFVIALPSMLLDLMCFTSFLARHGHLDPQRALDTETRALEWQPVEARPNRAERRRAERARRRMH